MRRGLLILVVVVSGLIVPNSAAAVRPTTGFVFADVRLLDTRGPGAPDVVDGVEIPVGTPGDIVNLRLLSPTVDTYAYVHACGTAPDRTAPAAAYSPANDTTVNLVPIRAGEGCVTVDGNGDLIVDLVGREGQPGGLDYVAHDEPVLLDVPDPSTGVVTVSAGDARVPTTATALAVWVTVAATESQLAVISFVPCAGGPSIQPTGLTVTAGHTHANLMVIPIDASAQLCFTAMPGFVPGEVFISRWGYLEAGATETQEGLPYSGFGDETLPGFTALTPARAFDTRTTSGAVLPADSVYRHTFAGLPADATAVAINLTAVQTGGPGFVTAYPCEGDRPIVSNVNYTGVNQVVPNFAIVPLGPSREVCFYTLAASHLIADVAGYFAWDLGDGYVPQQPSRLFDTRTSGQSIPAGGTYVAQLTAPSDTSAVVLNVTVTEPQAPGFITVHPCDVAAPVVSNLNYLAGQTRPNLVTVRVPADGRVCFYSSARSHLVVDVAGSYQASSTIGFAAAEQPGRVFDTRDAGGIGALQGREEYVFGLGTDSIRAVAWNLTATEPAAPGFVTLYPCGTATPSTSNVNYTRAGETVANFGIIQPDAQGDICIWSLATTHLIGDEAGVYADMFVAEVFYEGDPDQQPIAMLPERLHA